MEHLIKLIESTQNIALVLAVSIIIVLLRMLSDSNKAKDKMAEDMKSALEKNASVVAAALGKSADAINALSSVVHEMKGIFQMVRK